MYEPLLKQILAGNMKGVEAELVRIAIFHTAIEALLWALFFFALYLVLKAGIRDGINESRLGDSWKAQVRAAERTEAEGGKLPPIRADR